MAEDSRWSPPKSASSQNAARWRQEIGDVATNSVTLSEQAGKYLDELVPSIRKTADLVQEISAASREQASGLEQVGASVVQLAQTTQGAASAAEELNATASELSSQADRLQGVVSWFRVGGEAAVSRPRGRAYEPTESEDGDLAEF